MSSRFMVGIAECWHSLAELLHPPGGVLPPSHFYSGVFLRVAEFFEWSSGVFHQLGGVFPPSHFLQRSFSSPRTKLILLKQNGGSPGGPKLRRGEPPARPLLGV